MLKGAKTCSKQRCFLTIDYFLDDSIQWERNTRQSVYPYNITEETKQSVLQQASGEVQNNISREIKVWKQRW